MNLFTRSVIFSLLTNGLMTVVKFAAAYLATAMYIPETNFKGDVSYLQNEVVIGGNILTSYTLDFVIGFIVVLLVFLVAHKIKLIK